MECNNPTYKLQKLIVEWRNSKKEHRTPPGAIETLETLIRSGADLDAVEQHTPCIPYVFWDPDLIKFFLQKGRDINAQDYAGNTALHLAAYYARLPAIRFLLDNMADPNLKNKYGDTPLWKVIKAIEDPLLLPKQLEEGFLAILEVTTDMTVLSGEGLTYLHAIHFNVDHFKNRSDIYRILVDKFPDVDVRATKHSFEKTPLMSACENHDTELCRILVDERNADVNARDMLGRTPLHFALSKFDSMFECVEFLLPSGAEPSAFMTCDLRANSDRFSLSKLVEIFGYEIQNRQFRLDMYEMAGARYILNDYYELGLDSWKKALRFRTMWGHPKPPSSDNLKTIYKVENEFMTEADLDNVPTDTEDDKTVLYRQALLTLHRISNGSWWGLMETLIIIMDGKFNHTKYLFIREMFPHIEANMSNREAESFLHEETTYRFLKLIDYSERSINNDGIMYRSLFANHIQFFLKLFIAPLKWWVKNVGNQVPSLAKYQTYLTFTRDIHQGGLISPEIAEQFFETLVSLDPRDEKGNGLLHLACQSSETFSHAHLLIQSGVNVREENLIGQTPMELLPGTPNAKTFAEKTKTLILEMVSRGAHVDYQTVPSFENNVLAQISDHFNPWPYVTLQCLSARVLARSNVNYKALNILPKNLRIFVDKHFYDKLCA